MKIKRGIAQHSRFCSRELAGNGRKVMESGDGGATAGYVEERDGDAAYSHILHLYLYHVMVEEEE
ncbi:hypothetical protein Csa_020749 [Cucumis sativus]|uniref:Uncharacterized protein n=1 Tax=Cucumis sativus TaxID=3659 RepID=A0A0A0KBV1_CUCSA|nr:hypothetical protein Csa_020749 [Cucumis sativus]